MLLQHAEHRRRICDCCSMRIERIVGEVLYGPKQHSTTIERRYMESGNLVITALRVYCDVEQV